MVDILAAATLAVLAWGRRYMEYETARHTVLVRCTGYYPASATTEKQRRMEGGATCAALWRWEGRGVRYSKTVAGTVLRKVDGKAAYHTLEQHMADPVAHPFFSVAGDPLVWSYGQALELAWLPTPPADWQRRAGRPRYLARVVDTGGHFTSAPWVRNSEKVVREPGHEPLDCLLSSSGSKYNPHGRLSTAAVLPGDTL